MNYTPSSEAAVNVGLYRNKTLVSTARPLSIFIGECPKCHNPVREEMPDQLLDRSVLTCPDCKVLANVERVYGVQTDGICDPSCQGARGKYCSCSCGGVNHGGAFSKTSHLRASAIEKLSEKREVVRVKREKRETAKKQKGQQEFAEWTSENADIVQFLDAAFERGDTGAFLIDMYWNLRNEKLLTPRQTEATRNSIEKRIDWAERDAYRENDDRVNGKPVPEGRMNLSGRIVSRKYKGADYGYEQPQYKMLVKCDGFKVWGSVPASLQDEVFAYTEDNKVPPNMYVAFSATVRRSDDDPYFGFFSRPTKARLIEETETSEHEILRPLKDSEKRERQTYNCEMDNCPGDHTHINDGCPAPESELDEMPPTVTLLDVVAKASESVIDEPAIETVTETHDEKPAPVAKRSGSHSECSHEASKSARAKCRRDRNK